MASFPTLPQAHTYLTLKVFKGQKEKFNPSVKKYQTMQCKIYLTPQFYLKITLDTENYQKRFNDTAGPETDMV